MSLSTTTQTAGSVARDEVRQAVNNLSLLRANAALTAAGAAKGTTGAKAKTVNTLTYQIDGVFKSKGATDDFWTMAGTVVAVSMFQKYMLLIDAAGAASIMEGVQASTAAGVVLPNPPQAKSIAAMVTVATDATHTFTPGTTAFDATGITSTFTDGFDAQHLKLIVLS